ncbi:MAG: hypothetical protein EXS30_08015 [Pedosphaera sp.]|nr:hypothetical protein [Pedosphaera sp.]
MNSPGWRAYEKFKVRQQLITVHDGILFDNPTGYPQGCYCRFCVEEFAVFLHRSGVLMTGNNKPSAPKVLFSQSPPPRFLVSRSCRDFRCLDFQ